MDRASGQTSQAPMGRRPETPANRVSQAAAVPAAKTPSSSGTPIGAGSGVSAQQGNLPAHPTTASGTAGGASAPAKPKFPIGVTIFIAILAFLLVGFICVGLLAAFIVSKALDTDRLALKEHHQLPLSPPPKPKATETPQPTEAPSPIDVTSALAAGQAHESQGYYQAAVNDYTAGIQLDANNPELYSKRGNCYKNLEQYSQALDDYNSAVRLRPDNADYYNDRGIVYWKAKQYDNAIADYNQTLKLNGKTSRAYNNRGLAYYDKGNIELALKDYVASMSADPQYADPYLFRVWMHSYGMKYDPALSHYFDSLDLIQSSD